MSKMGRMVNLFFFISFEILFLKESDTDPNTGLLKGSITEPELNLVTILRKHQAPQRVLKNEADVSE